MTTFITQTHFNKALRSKVSAAQKRKSRDVKISCGLNKIITPFHKYPPPIRNRLSSSRAYLTEQGFSAA